MPRAKAITLSPTAADADGFASDDLSGGAGTFTLDGALASGGTVTLSQPQHVTITSANNDSGVTFTVTGTDRYGNAMTEAITGPNATTVTGTKNFATVTSIANDSATVGVVTAGVDGTCESQWYVLNYRGPDFNVAVAGVQSGTATWTVQHTFDNVMVPGFVEDDATVFNHDSLAAKSANEDGNYTNPPVAVRMAVTAHTSGTVTLHVVHAGRS